MKTHFTSAEIAHVWAHQSAPHGKSPGAMSFNGAAFLSYGTEIARHIEHKGRKAVILNDTSYSVTTSGHQNHVERALPAGVPVFHIAGIGRGCSLRFDNPGKNLFEYAVGQAAYYASKIPRARNKGQYEAQQAQWMERAQQVSEFFGLRRKVDGDTIRRLRESAAKAEAKAQREREKREAADRAEQAADYQAWKDGERERHLYFRTSLFPVAFRVEGEYLVSTLGARVPLDEAKRAFRFALAARAKGWHRNGESCPVGMYHLDAINEHGVVAGCHRITWEEVERLTPVLA